MLSKDFYMHILIVIDMQNDFVSGSLGSDSAKKIVPKMIDYVLHFDGSLYFTRDTHGNDYLFTEEGRHLAIEHCIKGTKGHEIIDELLPYTKNATVIDKPTFGSVLLAESIKKMDEKNKVKDITLCGVCTDICVISNALLLKAYLPNIPIRVISSLCAGSSDKAHFDALSVLKCCQIDVI